MRRRHVLGLGALALAGAGCSRGKRRTIGVIPKSSALLYWQSVHAGAARAAGESGVEIAWNSTQTETDYPGQVEIVESMINRRVDAVVLAPLDRVVLVGVVERAMRQGIPVIIMDSPVDTELFVSRVATDNYGAGRLGAERIGKILGGKGQVGMVMTQPGAASTMAREQGFQDALKEKFPGIVIADQRFGMGDFAKSLAVAENMLTAHPDLDAIFASNETSSVGAVQAIKSRQRKVKLVGFDYSPPLADGLKSGLIDSLIVQHPYRMGYQAVKAAVRKLNGQPVGKINDQPARLVTLENLNDADIQAQLNPELKF